MSWPAASRLSCASFLLVSREIFGCAVNNIMTTNSLLLSLDVSSLYVANCKRDMYTCICEHLLCPHSAPTQWKPLRKFGAVVLIYIIPKKANKDNIIVLSVSFYLCLMSDRPRRPLTLVQRTIFLIFL